jgi:hypothetical protein
MSNRYGYDPLDKPDRERDPAKEAAAQAKTKPVIDIKKLKRKLASKPTEQAERKGDRCLRTSTGATIPMKNENPRCVWKQRKSRSPKTIKRMIRAKQIGARTEYPRHQSAHL